MGVFSHYQNNHGSSVTFVTASEHEDKTRSKRRKALEDRERIGLRLLLRSWLSANPRRPQIEPHG